MCVKIYIYLHVCRHVMSVRLHIFLYLCPCLLSISILVKTYKPKRRHGLEHLNICNPKRRHGLGVHNRQCVQQAIKGSQTCIHLPPLLD